MHAIEVSLPVVLSILHSSPVLCSLEQPFSVYNYCVWHKCSVCDD